MGVCKLPGTEGARRRRLDLKVYHVSEYPYAVMYFTGSKNFNRAMRLYANHQGFSLSDHGLTRIVKVGREKFATGAPVACSNERDIFSALGLPYFAPQDRDCVPACLLDFKKKLLVGELKL